MSVPSSCSRLMLANPRLEFDVISRTVSRPTSSRSIGSVIAASTSSAEAPVHFTPMVTKSMSKVGKNCVFSLLRAHAPTRSMIAISRLQATGWLAKTAMSPAGRSGARGGGGGRLGHRRMEVGGTCRNHSGTKAGVTIRGCQPGDTTTTLTFRPSIALGRCVTISRSDDSSSGLRRITPPAPSSGCVSPRPLHLDALHAFPVEHVHSIGAIERLVGRHHRTAHRRQVQGELHRSAKLQPGVALRHPKQAVGTTRAAADLCGQPVQEGAHLLPVDHRPRMEGPRRAPARSAPPAGSEAGSGRGAPASACRTSQAACPRSAPGRPERRIPR